jgi:hypothetical protein
MRKFIYLLMAFTLISILPTGVANAKTKPKSKAATDIEAFFKKLGTAFQQPAKKKPVKRAHKKRAAVTPVFPAPMPTQIAAMRAGMTEEEYKAQQAPVQVPAVENAIEETVAVEDLKNPYLGQDCKANETDPVMCMTCIVYFESKIQAPQKAQNTARAVKA